MTERTVTDSAGRTWTCALMSMDAKHPPRNGQDVVLKCTTPGLPEPVMLTVGWQWQSMSANGLARLVSRATKQ